MSKLDYPIIMPIPHITIIVPSSDQQIINNNQDTTILIWTGKPIINTGGILYDPIKGEFEIPISGIYEISIFISWDMNPLGEREICIHKISKEKDIIIASDTRNSLNISINITLSTQHYFLENDKVYVSVWQNSDSDIILSPGYQNGNKILINKIY